mmetsp:Transcript_13032/g.31082  ORF Transcript_13032/g.31082 Transcript_13032/m.31082 type:complete len:97 (+) Transcript_13032:1644-1934(+)
MISSGLACLKWSVTGGIPFQMCLTTVLSPRCHHLVKGIGHTSEEPGPSRVCLQLYSKILKVHFNVSPVRLDLPDCDLFSSSTAGLVRKDVQTRPQT